MGSPERAIEILEWGRALFVAISEELENIATLAQGSTETNADEARRPGATGGNYGRYSDSFGQWSDDGERAQVGAGARGKSMRSDFCQVSRIFSRVCL